MKKLIISACAVAISSIVNGQDIITLKSGEDIPAKINEIGVEEIKYRKAGDGPMYVVKKSDVFSVKYSDGKKEVFNTSNSGSVKLTDSDLMRQGEVDAARYYSPKGVGSGATILTTIVFSPIIGVIPAAVCSSSPISEVNLRIPKNEYSNNANYIIGYKNEANKMKKRKIWRSFGITAGINAVLWLFLL